jgi:hypothetical protein
VGPPAQRYHHDVIRREADAGARGSFRVVQPWGRDKARQSTTVSEHPTAAAAFAAIDRLAFEMVRTGTPSDAVELVVISPAGEVVQRPGTN